MWNDVVKRKWVIWKEGESKERQEEENPADFIEEKFVIHSNLVKLYSNLQI